MCTLTWRTGADGTQVLFNRDEQRTRAPATPPALHMRDGVRFLAALDTRAGGTWLAVNEYGMTVAILNYYDAETRPAVGDARYRSRGLLVMELAGVAASSDLLMRLSGMELETYRPFILAGIQADGRAGLLRWDGASLQVEALTPADLPVTTSSFHTAAVIAARRARFAEQVGSRPVTADALEAFHRGRDPLGGAYSVTMTRPDALTVSFSKVTVGAGEISYYYQPRAAVGDDPEYAPGVEAVMPRR